MVAASGVVHPHASAQSEHQSPPRPTLPHLIYHLSQDIIFLMKWSRYHFSNKILEISLVFTHGITPARVNHNRYFVKKSILMFHAKHVHLASFFAYNSKHHVDTVFDYFITMLVSLLVVSRCKL